MKHTRTGSSVRILRVAGDLGWGWVGVEAGLEGRSGNTKESPDKKERSLSLKKLLPLGQQGDQNSES